MSFYAQNCDLYRKYMMTVMKKKNTFRLKQKLYEWWSYILKNRNNKYDCIVIDRFLMGEGSEG